MALRAVITFNGRDYVINADIGDVENINGMMFNISLSLDENHDETSNEVIVYTSDEEEVFRRVLNANEEANVNEVAEADEAEESIDDEVNVDYDALPPLVSSVDVDAYSPPPLEYAGSVGNLHTPYYEYGTKNRNINDANRLIGRTGNSVLSEDQKIYTDLAKAFDIWILRARNDGSEAIASFATYLDRIFAQYLLKFCIKINQTEYNLLLNTLDVVLANETAREAANRVVLKTAVVAFRAGKLRNILAVPTGRRCPCERCSLQAPVNS